MKTARIGVGATLIVLGVVFFVFSRNEESASDYRNVSYVIEGEVVGLVDGVSDVESAPGSASRTVTRHFGNELFTDLNSDGQEDVVFLVTQERGGSGTFFYVVAALAGDDGYIGSDGYLLGDRIAPQAITTSPNPRHVGVIVANYVTRAPDESFSVAPSVGKSAYLKLDTERMQWGIVAPSFEGESR